MECAAPILTEDKMVTAAHPRRSHLQPADVRQDREVPVRSSELGEAAMACDFPLLIWELPQGVVRLTDQAAAHLAGRAALEDLIGVQLVDLLDPREAVEQVMAALGSGAIDSLQSTRQFRRLDGQTVAVVIWSRIFDLNGRLAVVSLVVPVDEVGRLGRDPSAPWQDLSPVAVGTADGEWRVKRVSSDVRDIVGEDPRNLVGTSILDMVHPDDVGALVDPARAAWTTPTSRCHVLLSHRSGAWVDVCILFAPTGKDPSEIAFAVVGPPEPTRTPTSRVAELELRLRRIAAEVRASGVLNDFEAVPSLSDHPQLGELTSREWEIVSRVLRGERVKTIAKALYVSPSTVRNHLTMIFRKFGVHSQLELIHLLRLPEQNQRPN